MRLRLLVPAAAIMAALAVLFSLRAGSPPRSTDRPAPPSPDRTKPAASGEPIRVGHQVAPPLPAPEASAPSAAVPKYRIPDVPPEDHRALIRELSAASQTDRGMLALDLGREDLSPEERALLFELVERQGDAGLRGDALGVLCHRAILSGLPEVEWSRLLSLLRVGDDEDFLDRLLGELSGAAWNAPASVHLLDALRRFYADLKSPRLRSLVVRAVTFMPRGPEKEAFLNEVATRPPDPQSGVTAIRGLNPHDPDALRKLLAIAQDAGHPSREDALEVLLRVAEFPEASRCYLEALRAAPDPEHQLRLSSMVLQTFDTRRHTREARLAVLAFAADSLEAIRRHAEHAASPEQRELLGMEVDRLKATIESEQALMDGAEK